MSEQQAFDFEKSLAAFEQGVQVTRSCQQALVDAEQKVRMLTEQNGQTLVQPVAGLQDGFND